jgi:hypothetical protein
MDEVNHAINLNPEEIKRLTKRLTPLQRGRVLHFAFVTSDERSSIIFKSKAFSLVLKIKGSP